MKNLLVYAHQDRDGFGDFFTAGPVRKMITTGLLLFFFAVCFSQEMPSIPKMQLDQSIENWNKVFGLSVKAVGW